MKFIILFLAAVVLATPAVGDQLFVYDSGRIGAYTTSGATLNASLITGGNASSFAVSGSNLFVTNFGTSTNGVYNPGSGSIAEYTTSGQLVNANFITGLNTPYRIVVSGSDLYVASTNDINPRVAGAGTIGKYTTSGATVNASLITGLDLMTFGGGLAVSGTNLFVGTGGIVANVPWAVREYTTSGTLVNPAFIPGIDPTGIAVVGSNLFVTNFLQAGPGGPFGSIGEYTTSGATVNDTLVGSITNPSTVFQPTAIVSDGTHLFVANVGVTSTGWVSEYTTAGVPVGGSVIPNFGFANGVILYGLNSPFGLAIVPEPSSFVLAALSLVGVIAWGRREKRIAPQ